MERKEIDKLKEKVQLTRQLGVEKSMLPGSVMGVATILGLIENGTVTYRTHKTSLPTEALWIYGTTDFANPVELIMLAQAKAEYPGGPAIYTSDMTAHTIPSYAERILLPSLISFYSLEGIDGGILERKVKDLPETHDIELECLKKHFSLPALNDYLDRLCSVVGQHYNFADLYRSLNHALAEKMAIKYQTAEEFLKTTKITVGDLGQEADRVEQILSIKNSDIKTRVFGAIETRLHELGHSTKAAPEAANELLSEFYRHVLGGSELWGRGSRRFFRANNREEGHVDIGALDPSLLLSDLEDINITLGGNAWVLVMQMLSGRFDNTQNIVVAHKNTRSGANYTLPLLASRNTQAYISPVVRVVPNGQQTLRGDGLDIGVYLLAPELISTVKKAFAVEDSEVIGGKRKVVIEVSSDLPTATTYTEPADSNSGKNVRRPINII